MELSIIIPVYNVENTLRRCVESVLNQSFQDFEMILVNDGSKDKSAEIADDYAAKNNKIRVIHQQNQGLSAARNAGIRLAKVIISPLLTPMILWICTLTNSLWSV